MIGQREAGKTQDAESAENAPQVAARTAAGAALALQRLAGNRATAALIQRQPAPPEPPGPKVIAGKVLKVVDPARWANRFAAANASRATMAPLVLTVASNTAYAFDRKGGSLREIGINLSPDVDWTGEWLLDVAHATWESPDVIAALADKPFSDEDVKAICAKLGYEFGKDVHWIFLDVEPEYAFATAGGAPAPKPPSLDTPAMRRKAKEIVADLTAQWRDKPTGEGPALVGTPTFTPRFSERTGWHVRIALDQEMTEVALTEKDKPEDVRKRVEHAVANLRRQYAPAPQKPPNPTPWAKKDAKGLKPPPWYVPFETSESLKGGTEPANAPALPAVVLYTPEEGNSHPTVMAGATYDFRMQVQWQYAGEFGVFEAMNAGYYWELLAASPDDWFRLSGEERPEQPQQPAPATTQQPPAQPAPKAEDARVGSGSKVTRADDATAKRKHEGKRVGEDMANDYEEGDYTGFAGEAVAGGFRIVKTQVVSMASDIIDRRGPDKRRITIAEPGYYLVRCISASTHSGRDPEKDFIRAPSVAVIPVKAQLNWAAAKVAAKGDLAKAAGKTAYERYSSELKSATTALDDARTLEKRFAADPTLQTRLSTDPAGAAAELSVGQLGVLALAEQNKTSVAQLVKDLSAQVEQGEKQKDKTEEWHGKLKQEFPVGASFVADETGQEIPLRLMVGVEDPTSDRPTWHVTDITSYSTQDDYKGTAALPGLPRSHGVALREALRKFAGENPYGYGEIGLAWPEKFGELELSPGELPRHLRSAPDAEKRKRNRHTAYVDIATFMIPVAKAAKLKSLVTALEAFVTAVSAKNAYDALKDRSRTGHLMEPGTLLELVQVIGAARTLGEGVHFVFEANELVRAARRVGQTLELLTKLEQGMQIVAIPFTVRDQLKAIDEMKGASPEHKAAALAFVFGRAIRDGIVTIRAIHPGEETKFYDDADEQHPGQHPPTPGEESPAKKPTEEEPKPPDHGGGGGGGPSSTTGGGKRLPGPIPGMPEPTVKTLKDFATAYGVVIDVRPTTPHAPEWHGMGAMAKPEAIKAKTINGYDRLLGAPEGAIGLVGYFEPHLPARPRGMDDADWGKLQERFHQRSDEFKNLAEDMAKLRRDGRARITQGVVELLDPRKAGQHYAPVTGDHDVFDIQWADPSRKMSDHQADAFAAMLRSMNIGVEHPAHMRWKPTSEKDQKAFQDIVAQHTEGPDFKENLIRFGPRADPQEVKAGTPVSPSTPKEHEKWDVTVTDPGHGGRSGGGGGGDGGGGGGRIPRPVHRSLQQLADVHGLRIEIRQGADGHLQTTVAWSSAHGRPGREMNAVEREAFNKMIEGMNLGVATSGGGTGAPLVTLEPTAAPRGGPSQAGSEQGQVIRPAPNRVDPPRPESKPPVAEGFPGRNGLTDREKLAFDRWIHITRGNGSLTSKFEQQLKGESADQLRVRIRRSLAELDEIDANRRRERTMRRDDVNSPDPRQARFTHNEALADGVTIRYLNQPPSRAEIRDAQLVARGMHEPIALYGDSFGSVDGTIGDPPRLFQLKTATDVATLLRVVNDARETARNFGDRAVEVHVVARSMSFQDAEGALRGRYGALLGSWLSRLVVHVNGGRVDTRAPRPDQDAPVPAATR